MFSSILLLVSLCVHSVLSQNQPKTCFNTTIDVISLHDCLAPYFAPNNSLSIADWNTMLPSSDEIAQFKQLVKNVMDSTDPNFCSPGTLYNGNYPAIADDITMIRFQSHFCVIFEMNLRPLKPMPMFNRCWGYVIIADNNWSKRDLHHSSPHPVSELFTDVMGVSMFFLTQSRSFISAGASREAVNGAISPCIADDLVADAAHDNRTMFHALSAAVYEHEGTCAHSNCAFIQWHSFANHSCPDTPIIISSGVDNSGGGYNSASTPAVLIASHYNQLGNSYAKTAKDSTCTLLALDNIQGRLYNGVNPSLVCTTNPTNSTVSGAFVNINQEQWLLDVSRWSQTIMMAYPTANTGLVVLPKIWAVILVVFAMVNFSAY